MKSTEEQLIKRGYLPEWLYTQIIDSQDRDIAELLKSKDPHVRTAGVRIIRKDHKLEYILPLCELLKKENKLYTKIEICECFAEYGRAALPYIIPLLGKIGKNQHKKIDLVDIGKKSFPLPRDIAARIIIRIGRDAFKYLFEVLRSNDASSILEAIDAVGYITFYTKDYSFEKELVEMYKNNTDELIKWKLVRSFQSFNSDSIVEILYNVRNDLNENKIIKKEAERSLHRIKSRSNC